MTFLRSAAEATCERSPQLAFLGSWGPVLLLGAWHARLSVALQKANAACLLQAGRRRGAEDFVEGQCWPGWEEDVDDCAINRQEVLRIRRRGLVRNEDVCLE